MNRIENRLNLLKEENKKAFITYITAGLPNLEKTKDIIKAESMSAPSAISQRIRG